MHSSRTRSRRTDTEPTALDADNPRTGHPGARRVPADNRSLFATLSMVLLGPLAVAAVSAPLATLAALVVLAALGALVRRTARRVAGRHTSLAVPGLGLRVDVAVAER